MSTTWITVSKDILQEDQVQTTATLNPNGTVKSVTSQVIENWIAQTDNTSYGTPTEAETATAGGNTIPIVGGLYAFAGFTGAVFTCTRVFPQRNGPYSFKVQVEYQWTYTPPISGKANITIKVGGQTYTQPAYYDLNNVPIQNSAGDPFDQPILKTYYDETFDISYDVTSDQSAALAAARGSVCNAPISFNIKGVSRSFVERQLKCVGAEQTITVPQADGTIVYHVDAKFVSRADTFITNVLDVGYMQINGSNTGKVAINCADGMVGVLAPQHLDGAGHYLSPTVNPNGVQLTFKIEPEADFTSLFTGLS